MQNQQQPSQVFAKNLRNQRVGRNLSQADLARIVTGVLGSPIHQTTIAKIESGDRGLSIDEAVAIAHSLGLNLESLMFTNLWGDEAVDHRNLGGARARLDSARAEVAADVKRVSDAQHHLSAMQVLAAEAVMNLEKCTAAVAYLEARLGLDGDDDDE